jgi:hypothetical protein
MCLSHDSVFNLYETNFLLMDDFGYSLSEIENMIPFEREIYISLLQKKLIKQSNKTK